MQKPKERVLSKGVSTRITEEKYAQLVFLAEQERRAVSDYIRLILNDEIEKRYAAVQEEINGNSNHV